MSEIRVRVGHDTNFLLPACVIKGVADVAAFNFHARRYLERRDHPEGIGEGIRDRLEARWLGGADA